jgi:diguanylate cyclase
LLLDIDHFKRFNDTYGHLAGDAVLACFARSIAQACGPNAFPCRYGGEEFAVVIRGDSETEVALAAASIRRTASESKISHEDLELTVTASAGLCIAQAGDDLTTAYERADEGLYQAKAEGRNRGLWLNNQSWELLPESATDPSWQPTRASDQKQSNAASQN